MVLIGDLVGDDGTRSLRPPLPGGAHRQRARRRRLRRRRPEARKRFWLDRARTAAIAKHTNAFKINEDVVIPLDQLGEYTEGIERINIEFSVENKLALLDALEEYFSRATALEDKDLLRGGPPAGRALELIRRGARALAGDRRRPRPLVRPPAVLCGAPVLEDRAARRAAPPVRRRRVPRILEGAQAVHQRVLRGRVFVALHMHAGDGNVHTNIPVNSDDYEMLAARDRRRGAHHAPRAFARRRDFRRARHRHHQARSS